MTNRSKMAACPGVPVTVQGLEWEIDVSGKLCWKTFRVGVQGS